MQSSSSWYQGIANNLTFTPLSQYGSHVSAHIPTSAASLPSFAHHTRPHIAIPNVSTGAAHITLRYICSRSSHRRIRHTSTGHSIAAYRRAVREIGEMKASSSAERSGVAVGGGGRGRAGGFRFGGGGLLRRRRVGFVGWRRCVELKRKKRLRGKLGVVSVALRIEEGGSPALPLVSKFATESLVVESQEKRETGRASVYRAKSTEEESYLFVECRAVSIVSVSFLLAVSSSSTAPRNRECGRSCKSSVNGLTAARDAVAKVADTHSLKPEVQRYSLARSQHSASAGEETGTRPAPILI
eukprot:3456531-Rhodomonas_salina.1